MSKSKKHNKGFVCQRCGKCCGVAPFTSKEFLGIEQEAKKRGVIFDRCEDKNGNPFYIDHNANAAMMSAIHSLHGMGAIANYRCPFLEIGSNGKSKCAIYNNRPEVCRLFGTNPENHPLLKCPNQK